MIYTLTSGSSVIRDADGAYIPDDPGNADWQTFQAWIAAGNTPNPAPAVAPVVPTCQVWQLKAVLTAAQTSAVEAAITASPNAAALQAFWETGDAPVPANSTTLLTLGATIGLTATQVMALVQQAAEVQIP